MVIKLQNNYRGDQKHYLAGYRLQREVTKN